MALPPEPCHASTRVRPSHDLTMTLVALAGLLLWEALQLDRWAAHLYGNGGGFALRDSGFASRVMHDGGRSLGWCVLAFLALDAWRQWLPGPSRGERLRGFAATLAALLLVPLLKRGSRTSCPWDLVEFGGRASYVSHWALGVTDGGPGRCFPSGHAVAAFAFFSGYFLLRQHRPALARTWLIGVLALGFGFGWAQLARGAHYPSHTLWSAWLCWLVCVGVARVPEGSGPEARLA